MSGKSRVKCLALGCSRLSVRGRTEKKDERKNEGGQASLAQEHNAMTMYGVQHAGHQCTAPPHSDYVRTQISSFSANGWKNRVCLPFVVTRVHLRRDCLLKNCCCICKQVKQLLNYQLKMNRDLFILTKRLSWQRYDFYFQADNELLFLIRY